MSSRPSKQSIIDRLLVKPGLRARINAHCVACSYDKAARGSWRKQVSECCVDSCPLYDVRALPNRKLLPKEGGSNSSADWSVITSLNSPLAG